MMQRAPLEERAAAYLEQKRLVLGVTMKHYLPLLFTPLKPESGGARCSTATLPPLPTDTSETRVRSYRESEEGVGKQCPTCKATVPLRRYAGHKRFCYKCLKCIMFKTNKRQHDPLCKGVPNVESGTPCPYCNGRRVSNLLRHLEQYHNFAKSELAVFRKNKVERGTPKEKKRRVRLNATKSKKKLQEIADATATSPESQLARDIIKATVRKN